MRKIFHNQSGQSLVEAMLAVALVLTLGYSLLNLGSLALRSASYASDRVVANQLMQEGLEILRAMRDEDGGWSTLSAISAGTVGCFNLDGTVRSGCYETNGDFKEDLLLGGNLLRPPDFERTFLVEEVKRNSTTNCPAGCSACGPVIATGNNIDNCSRKITVQVAWPGVTTACNDGSLIGNQVKGNKYCVKTTSILTDWKR